MSPKLGIVIALPAVCAIAGILFTIWGGPLSAAPPPSRAAPGRSVVEFEIKTALSGLGGSSSDQISIIFADVSADSPLLPSPLFGGDIRAEFSFSALDARVGRILAFSRRVNDVSFLDSPFIRVVNHGSDGWAGEWISLRVDGRPVLNQQSLYPRRGRNAKIGIEKFNPAQWSEKAFWEAPLQSIRLDRKKY
jgi:hypothetical protein